MAEILGVAASIATLAGVGKKLWSFARGDISCRAEFETLCWEVLTFGDLPSHVNRTVEAFDGDPNDLMITRDDKTERALSVFSAKIGSLYNDLEDFINSLETSKNEAKKRWWRFKRFSTQFRLALSETHIRALTLRLQSAKSTLNIILSLVLLKTTSHQSKHRKVEDDLAAALLIQQEKEREYIQLLKTAQNSTEAPKAAVNIEEIQSASVTSLSDATSGQLKPPYDPQAIGLTGSSSEPSEMIDPLQRSSYIPFIETSDASIQTDLADAGSSPRMEVEDSNGNVECSKAINSLPSEVEEYRVCRVCQGTQRTCDCSLRRITRWRSEANWTLEKNTSEELIYPRYLFESPYFQASKGNQNAAIETMNKFRGALRGQWEPEWVRSSFRFAIEHQEKFSNAGWTIAPDPTATGSYLYVDMVAGRNERINFRRPPIREVATPLNVRGWRRVENPFGRIYYEHLDSGLGMYQHPSRSPYVNQSTGYPILSHLLGGNTQEFQEDEKWIIDDPDEPCQLSPQTFSQTLTYLQSDWLKLVRDSGIRSFPGLQSTPQGLQQIYFGTHFGDKDCSFPKRRDSFMHCQYYRMWERGDLIHATSSNEPPEPDVHHDSTEPTRESEDGISLKLCE